MSEVGITVGRVIGTKPAQPLDFWIAVDPDGFVQLDEVIAVTTKLPVALADGRDHVVERDRHRARPGPVSRPPRRSHSTRVAEPF